MIATLACSSNHSGTAQSASSFANIEINQQSLDAFQSSVYAFGQSQGCVKCHGATVSPLWLSTNLSFAYSLAASMVDFNNPAASIFALYSGNNHCNDPACQNTSNVSVMQNNLTQWASVEALIHGDSPPITSGTTLANPAFVTAAMPVPASIPLVTTNTTAVIRFDLTNLTPQVEALKGAILEISIQHYNAGLTQYKIFNPRLMGATAPVTLSGLHVYIRAASGTGLGMEDTNQGLLWSALHVTPMVVAIPSPLPTGPSTSIAPLTRTSLAAQVQSTEDVIAIGFASIQ